MRQEGRPIIFVGHSLGGLVIKELHLTRPVAVLPPTEIFVSGIDPFL